jgi:GT2 family glycosyltransferase
MKGWSSGLFDVDWVEGSFVMVSRRCIEEVGPLDPLLFLFWEEADYCRRARCRGYRVVIVPRALARHYGGGTCETDRASPIAALRSRNHYIYKLANPVQSFARNTLDAMHLFGVNLKAGFRRDTPHLIFEIRIFMAVLARLGRVYRKWRNDRAGKQPEVCREDLGSISVEVLPASG